ncbi:hypothetical protein QOT17_006953 [Balamuthia mandrillaris]
MVVHLVHYAPSRSSSYHFNTTPTATNEERHRRKRGGEINRFSEQEIKRWSKARVRAWLGRRTNPDQYYYRFPDLGVRQRMGKWSKDEYEVFLKRHHEFKLKGWWVGSRWGIFSATPGLEHRVGYQCSNLYRRLVKENILHDPSYGLDSTGKFGLIGGIPDGASDVPPEMHVLNTEVWNAQSAALEQKVDRWVRLYHPGEAPIGFVRFMRHRNATRRNGRGSRCPPTNLPPFLHHFSSTAEKSPDIEEGWQTPSPTGPQRKSTTTTTKSPNTKRSPTRQLTPTSTASTTPKRNSPSRPPFAQINFSTEEAPYQLQRDLDCLPSYPLNLQCLTTPVFNRADSNPTVFFGKYPVSSAMDFILQGDFQPYFTALQQRLAILYSSELKGSSGEDETEILSFLWFLLGSIRSSFTKEIELDSRISCFERLAVCLNHLFESLGTLQPEWYHDNHNTWMHQSFKIVSFCKSAVLECYFWICRSCAKEEVRAHLSSVDHEQEIRLFQDAMNMLKGHALSLMEELLKLVGDCPTLMALPSFCSGTDGSRLEPNTVVLGLWRKVMHIFDDFPHQAAGSEKQVKDFWATFNDTILGLTSLPSFQENAEEKPDEVTSRSSEGTKPLVLNEFRWEMLFRLIPLHLFDEEGKFKQQSSTSSNQSQWLFNYDWATTKNWLLVEALIERSPLGLRADGDELNFQATKMMTTSLKWDISRLKGAILMRCIELAEFWGTNEHLVALLWQYFRVHYQPMNQEDSFSELVVQHVLECPVSVAYKFYPIGQYSSEFELFLKLLLTELKKTGCPKRIHRVRKRLLEGLSTPITNPTTLQHVLALELVFARFMNHEYKLAQLPHAIQLYSSGSNTECQRIVTRALFIAALMLLQTSQDIKNWAERYLLEPFETVCKDYVDLQMRLKSLNRENKGIPSHLEDELQKTESLLYKLLHHMEMMFRLRHSRDSLCSDYVLISPSLKHLVQHLDLLSESIAIRLLDMIHYSMQLKNEQSSPDLSTTQPPIITSSSTVDNGSEEDDPFSFMDGIAFEDLDRMVEEHRSKQQNYPIANQIYAHLFDPLISAITRRLPVHILERSVTCLASMAPLLVHFKFCQWSHLKALYSNSFMVRSNADVSQRSIPIWFWLHILRAQHAESLCIKPCIKEFILEHKFFLLNIWLLSTIERSHYEPPLNKQLQNTPTIPYFQNMHGVKKVTYIVKHVMECLSEEWQQANKACGETPTSVAAVKQQFMEVTSQVHLVIHRSVADRLEQKEEPQLQRFIALMYSIIGNLFVYLPELLYTKGNANHNTLAALLNGYFFGPFHSAAPVGGMALPLRERNTMLLRQQHVGRSFGRYRGSSPQSVFSQARSQEDISLLNAQRQLLTNLYQNAVWGFVQAIPVCLAHFDLHGDGYMSRSLAQFFACFYEGLYQQFALHFDYKELDGLDITKRPSVPARLDELVKGMLIRGDRTQRKGLGSLRRFVMGTVVPMFLRIPLDKNLDGHGTQAVFAALQSPLFVIFTIRFVERLECLSLSSESTPAKTDEVQNDDVVLATTWHGWHHLFLDFLPIMLPLLEVFTFTSSSFDRAPVHLMKSEAYHLAALLFRTLGEADAKELQQQQEGCIGMDGKTNAHWQILQHFACCLLLHIVRDVYLLWKGEQFFQNCQSLESLRMRLDDEKEQLARLLSSSCSPGCSSFAQQYADIRKGIQGDANQRQLSLSSPLFGPHSYYQYTQPVC